ncbi:MAG: hypothetical protein IJL87_08160 [Clostridia bacterium]|nr:hypothetical protein [Clostridia bacterium]
MDIKYLDDASGIIEAFIRRFVMSWETFQIKSKDWMEKMKKKGRPITKQWYEKSFMWDKMDPKYPSVSFKEALDFLRSHPGSVLFTSDKNNFFEDNDCPDLIAQADACKLADRIEFEWFESYRLAEQYMYISNALPEDLYVFDLALTWCVVFTHETSDWAAELHDDMMKAAQSRVCIICKE